jgi:O-antigen/teichoic acid export membrane protein
VDVKRRLVANTAAAYGATAVTYAVGLIAAPYFIHRLGGSAYGVATLIDVFTITGWMSLLELGIQSSSTRFVAQSVAREDWETASRIVSSAVALFFLVGAVVALGLLGAAGWLSHSAFNIPQQYESSLFVTLQVLSIALAVQFPGLAIASALEGTQRADLISIVRALTTVGGTAVAFVVVGSGQGLTAYMLVITLAPAAGVVLLTAWLLLRCRQIRLRPRYASLVTLKTLLPLSGQIFVARIAILAFLNTDKIIIGAVLTTTALTQYSIAAKIYSFVYVIGVLMNSAVTSASSHYHATGDWVRLQELLLRGTKYAMAVTLPLAAAILVLAPDLTAAWIGPAYRSSGLTTQIWLASLFVPVMTGVASIMLIGMNQMRAAVWMSIGSAVVNLALSIPGAYIWGVNGVVLGSSVAWLIVGPPFLVHILRLLDIPLARFFAQTVRPTLPWIGLAALVGLGGLVLSLDSLPALVGLLVAAEGLALAGFLLKGVTPHERASLFRGSSPIASSPA